MPVLSYLHQLFNAEQCQAYIRTLRWHDRPLQCPRCQSHHIGQWGTYQYRPGCKRYWCHGCQRTFNDLTQTLLHRTKRPLSYWILATFLLCLACSSRRIARELGVHGRTSYRWCWWLRNAALSYEMQRQLEGTVEADDLYHTAGHKGQATHGGKKVLGRRARGRRKKREPGWGAYERHLDAEQHEVGKANTQKIESKHINLRTRVKRLMRRTICFSKTEHMHDLVLGLFINRYEFGRPL